MTAREEEGCFHAHRPDKTGRRTRRRPSGSALPCSSFQLRLPVVAGPVCTLVMEAKVRPPVAPVIGDKCETRVSPSSTFDIALSLMGFDSGLLTTPDRSTWPNGAGQPGNRRGWTGADDSPHVAPQFGRAIFAGAGEGSWLSAAATVRRQHQFR